MAAGALPAAAEVPLAETAVRRGKRRLRFSTIPPQPVTSDELKVPPGYGWKPIIRWGDPMLPGGRPFDGANQTPEAQAKQFGYNCDYLCIMVTNDEDTKALLVANHEYTNENIMFPPGYDPATVIRTAWAAHGMSVVELERKGEGKQWKYKKRGKRNRRITATTPFKLDGPAAGSTLLRTAADPTGRRVLGTLNNCAGGKTPWGTVLSGEENFNQYFKATGTDPKEARYGLSSTQDIATGARSTRAGTPPTRATSTSRTGSAGSSRSTRSTRTSTPVKHTAMGRFKHEGANVIIAKNGHVVAYMGDDERFDYLYRFVSKKKYNEGDTARDRRRNLRLLSQGDLYVARFTGDGLGDGVSDGTGRWIPLTKDGQSMVPGFTLDEVLVYTRLAADAVQATKMDRPEDVEPNLDNGKVYVACTNNTDRGKPGKEGPTEPNPRNANKDGHVVEITPRRGDHTAGALHLEPAADLRQPGHRRHLLRRLHGPGLADLLPGQRGLRQRGPALGRRPTAHRRALGQNDGLFKVNLEGRLRGRTRQFLSVPTDAETCGPVIHDRDRSVFVAVQHPGEEGTWAAPRSRFPDYVPVGGTPEEGRVRAVLGRPSSRSRASG